MTDTIKTESDFQFSQEFEGQKSLSDLREAITKAKETKSGKELLDYMTEAARAWQPDFKEYKEMLDFRAKFHKYSLRNIKLIYLQNPNADYVGSFNHFKKLGYKINKGARGMLILAPRNVTLAQVNNGAWKPLGELTEQQKAELKNGSLKQITKTYFVKGYVFDISQTNCPQEDLPKLLRGMSENREADKYYAALKGIVKKYGIDFSEKTLNSVTLKGFFVPSEERIVINDRISLTDKAAVLTHELSHALLHANGTELSSNQIEFEAESTAYIALKQSGFDLSDYSFKYIHDYLKELSPEELQSALTRIDNCGNLLCKELEEQLKISRLPQTELYPEMELSNN